MAKKPKRFKDSVVLVTGAGQGMGRAVALAFASEGARVAVNDLNGGQAQKVANEINRRGGKAISIQADVTDKDEVDGMVQKTLSKFRTIDILVNNAGMLYSTAVDKISGKEWDMVMAVNLKGAFLYILQAQR